VRKNGWAASTTATEQTDLHFRAVALNRFAVLTAMANRTVQAGCKSAAAYIHGPHWDWMFLDSPSIPIGYFPSPPLPGDQRCFRSWIQIMMELDRHQ
jgi:hypothetical protein